MRISEAITNNSNGKKIKMVPLSEVLKGKKNVAIKCDCEGGEYKIFTKCVNLSNVYAIMLEYHNGKQLLPTIFAKQGFKIKARNGYIFALK